MANFSLFIPILQRIEGNFQKMAGDQGNYNSLHQLVGTNFGISARFYEGIIGRPPTETDMRNITKARAQQLYKTEFWDAVQGDSLSNQSVANIITDHAVNGGEGSIGKIVQRILVNDFHKAVTIDGDIGPKTAAVINSVNQAVLFDKIKAARKTYYLGLGGEFLNSWLNRLKDFTYTEKKP